MNRGEEMKYKIYLLITFFFLSILSILPSKNVYAERVYGAGFYGTLGGYTRTNFYKDPSVEPPLNLDWTYTNMSGIPFDKGYMLNYYKLFFGKNNTIYGLNNQTGTYSPTQLDKPYVVGNPFTYTYPSQFGKVNTSMEQVETSSPFPSESSHVILFGTDTGLIGKWGGFSLDAIQGIQRVSFSPNSNGSSLLYGGAINYISHGGAYNRVAAGSTARLHMIDITTMDRTWYFDINSLPGFETGDQITGITNLGNEGTSKSILVTTKFKNTDSYGLIFTDTGTVLGRYSEKKPTYQVKFQSGIPKASAYDVQTDTIVSVDEEGRVYYHTKNGINKNPNGWAFAGNSSTRGYPTVGGAAIYNSNVYVSTKSSSDGNKGTITKFSLTNPNSKSYYIHDKPITTTPIIMTYGNGNEICYFGDSSGRVYALSTKTMQKIKWYKDENGDTHEFYQAGTSPIENLQGADNHLISSSASGIYAFKGKPDYSISGLSYKSGNSSSPINGARVDFTTSLPILDTTIEFYNQGSFDYDIYTDFGGRNDQKISIKLKHLDTNTTKELQESELSIDEGFYQRYKSEFNNSKLYFQIPKYTAVPIQYQFKPSEEGEYQFIASSDTENYQREFNESNNSLSATIKIVDMNKPTAVSDKTNYFIGDTVTFSLSKTQKYSYKSFNFELKYPDGSQAMYIDHQESFAKTVKFSNLNKKGTYQYRVSINNRYGQTIYGDWKTFSVLNRPPVADFTYSPTSNINIDTSISFQNNSSDPDNDTLTYKWEYQKPNSTTWTSFSTAKTPSARNFPEKGNWNIRLTVSDGTATDTAVKTISVGNRPPVAAFTYKPTSNINIETYVEFTNSSSDPDRDELTYKWEYQKPNSTTWISFSTEKTPPKRIFDIRGNWNIRLTVSDGAATDSVTKPLTVMNRPPIAGFTTDKSSYYNNESISIVPSATDPDNDTLSYSYKVTKPDGNISTYTSPNPKIGGLQIGTYTIEQTVTDGHGGKDTITKYVSVVNRPPVAGFITNKTVYLVGETATITSQASDPDGHSLTYLYEVTKPDGKKITFTDANPTIPNLEIGKYTIKQTVKDPYNASSQITKTIEVKNTPPSISLTYTPNEPYEGDTVNICAKVKDPDGQKLDVKLYLKEENSSEKLVLTKTQVLSDTQHCYSFTSNAGRNDVRATVSDGYESTEVTTWFYSKPLTLKGHVEHTPDWLKKHQEMGHSLNQFYSGEKFLLSADTSPYPVEYIKSTLIATRADGQTINRTVNLNGVSAILHTGELYDEQFLQPPTSLKKGPAKFEFEVKYRNGVIKKDVVSIEIIDHVYEVYRIHRKY
jgi:PKD domain